MIRPALEQGLAEMGMSLSEECLQSCELFAVELKKWNLKVNLTSIIKDADVAVKHIIDSLVFARCVNDGDYLLDIGSGAGVPAIPLKIARPAVRVVSVDAVGKKILFQRHIARLLALQDFEAVHSRIENLHSSHGNRFDVITSRAFSRLDTFVVLAAPLLKSGGRIIAMKGPQVDGELGRDAEGLRSLGFEINAVDLYSLPMDKGERSLVTVTAVNAHQ
ncbi:MAG: 16S rRNA (guanine(527)-N(7))-methyltransferase RsmG [Desulfobacteraceae bacterium]|nr:16S rRNA (guanine(527)-N(7))-methyltransferase RsmG [Desulfobacteraceae bacterium]